MLTSLIFVVYFVMSSFASTSNSSKHSGVILKHFLYSSFCSKRIQKGKYTPNTPNIYWLKSNRLQVFYEIDNLKDFAKFSGKHLNWSHVALLKAWNLLKRDSSAGIFLWILRNLSKNHIYRTSLVDCYCWFLRSS